MEVRIKIEDKIESFAILNSGFISSDPEIAIPLEIAEKLDIIRDAESVEYKQISGNVRILRSRRRIKVKVITEERESKEIECYALIVPGLDICLLNDKAISELEIIIYDAGKGLWKFRDEEKIRRSV